MATPEYMTLMERIEASKDMTADEKLAARLTLIAANHAAETGDMGEAERGFEQVERMVGL
jgi:hypothetical protein